MGRKPLYKHLSFIVTLVLLLCLIPGVVSAYPNSVDNGDGTYTLVYRPGPGNNDGTDQGGPDGGKDTYDLRNEGGATANTNNGDVQKLHHFNSSCNLWVGGSYYQFDVSALPAADQVQSVTLVFYQQIGRGFGYQLSNTRMVVQAVTAPWDEMSLTFNTRPPVSPTIEAEVNIPTVQGAALAFEGYVELDITGLYRDWRSGARPNYGIHYSRPQTVCENTNWNQVWSSDHEDEEKRPALNVVYVPDTTPPPVPADTTPPEIVHTVTGTLGNDGWYISDVTVEWTVTDPESDITSTTGCDTTLVDADTAGTTLTCEATSAGGTASSSVTLKRDATPPVVTYTGNNGVYMVDEDLAILCSAADNLSGVIANSCDDITGPAYTFLLGENTYSAEAIDAAGNVGMGATTFTVEVDHASLRRLTERFVTNRGILRALQAHLDNAERSAARGKDRPAAVQLDAYVHLVQSQLGKSLTTEHAEVLVRLAEALKQ